LYDGGGFDMSHVSFTSSIGKHLQLGTFFSNLHFRVGYTQIKPITFKPSTLPPNFTICGGSHTTSKINTKRKKSSKTNQLMMSLIELCIIKTYDSTILANLLDKHKDTVPLAGLIEAMHVGKKELISFKIAINEAIDTYGLTPSAAVLHVINIIKDYNKKGQLQRELSSLYLQKYAINEFCSRYSQAIMAIMNLQSHGITEEQIISLDNFLERNGYNIDMKSTEEYFDKIEVVDG
jgi:hypothetical protein